MASKKEKDATLAVLNNTFLSTVEKVDKLLKIKQEGKMFQDAGERLPGSRKEGAALRMVYKHEDEKYKDALLQAFDQRKLDNETKQRLADNAYKTYQYEVCVKRLIDRGDDLRNRGYQKEAVKQYLDALYMVEEYRQKYPRDAAYELWYKKAIFMASNGMGIAYSKWGKPEGAIDSFADAVLYAPTEKTRQVAKTNLDKYQKASKDKTGVEFNTHLIDSFGKVSKI